VETFQWVATPSQAMKALPTNIPGGESMTRASLEPASFLPLPEGIVPSSKGGMEPIHGEPLVRSFKDLVGLLVSSGVTRAVLNSFVTRSSEATQDPRARDVAGSARFESALQTTIGAPSQEISVGSFSTPLPRVVSIQGPELVPAPILGLSEESITTQGHELVIDPVQPRIERLVPRELSLPQSLNLVPVSTPELSSGRLPVSTENTQAIAGKGGEALGTFSRIAPV
jgi:hypothetical protein